MNVSIVQELFPTNVNWNIILIKLILEFNLMILIVKNVEKLICSSTQVLNVKENIKTVEGIARGKSQP